MSAESHKKIFKREDDAIYMSSRQQLGQNLKDGDLHEKATAKYCMPLGSVLSTTSVSRELAESTVVS
jgi:hypothetical protein